MKEFLNNYEKLILEWEQKTLSLDFEKIKKILTFLENEGDYWSFFYYNQKYYLNKKTAKIITKNEEVEINTKLSMYPLFWYVKSRAKLLNEWVPFRKVAGAYPFNDAFQRTILDPLAHTFQGKLDYFKKATKKLNGEEIKAGDAGYLIKSFDCIPLKFIIWDGDAEFEPSANILFDISVTDFIHVESTATIAADGVKRLANSVGLKVSHPSFLYKE